MQPNKPTPINTVHRLFWNPTLLHYIMLFNKKTMVAGLTLALLLVSCCKFYTEIHQFPNICKILLNIKKRLASISSNNLL